MLEEAVFVIFTLLALSILVVKLLNVLQVGRFYDPEWSIVTFVILSLSFMFILFMVLGNRGENPEFASYLWGHIVIFITSSILFVCEVLIWFFIMLPKSPGKEKYGDRGRLTIDRRQ
jgi:hypothetical protein